MEAAAFASASQLGTAGNCSSSSSSSAGSRSIRFMQICNTSLTVSLSNSNLPEARSAPLLPARRIPVQTSEEVLKAKHCFFPGVGAFATAMDVLNKKARCPFLGICLGMQLLFESSQENGPGLQHASAAAPEGPWKFFQAPINQGRSGEKSQNM